MTDYTKATGTGTMLIRDTGSVVEFWLKAGDPYAWINDGPYSWYINGASGTGTYAYPRGGGWLRIKSTTVSTNQTVNFSIGATGLSLGGPTSFSVAITRVAPISVSNSPATAVSAITASSAHIALTAPTDNGGDPIDLYYIAVLKNNRYPNSGGIFVGGWNASSVTVTGLAKATEYYYTARAHNSAGWSAYTPMKYFFTLATVPDVSDPVVLSAATQTSVLAVFAGNGNGGSSITAWQIGYGTSPTAPQTIVTGYNLTINNLLPATTYYFWSRCVNAIGAGAWSAVRSIHTIAGARLKVGLVWHEAVPYVKVAGVWKVVRPWARIAGVWKQTG